MNDVQSKAPFVSLIVCTRNRASALRTFLASVTTIEAPPGGWELILVDNASSDDTLAVIRSFAESAPFRVRPVSAPVPGLARARNAGVAAASGDLLVFTDDDCYPATDYLVRVVEVFEESRPGFVGGRVVLHDPTDAPVTICESPVPQTVLPRTFVRPGLIHGANMAISRDLLRAIGGFDPHLGAGTACVSGEDADYLARASWAGWTGRYDPRPTVSHHHGRKPGADIARLFEGYDYGRGAYYLKFLLARPSRRVYFQHWWGKARRALRKRRLAKPWREILGAARYATLRIRHPEPVPRFDEHVTGETRNHVPSAR